MSIESKIETTVQPAMDTATKSGDLQQASVHGSEFDSAWTPRGIDPELVAAVSQIPPGRRAEIEKRVRLKLDFILFPTLLAFYILNYIVCVVVPYQLELYRCRQGLISAFTPQDRNALSFAKIVNIQKDLKLSSTELLVFRCVEIRARTDLPQVPHAFPYSMSDTVL